MMDQLWDSPWLWDSYQNILMPADDRDSGGNGELVGEGYAFLAVADKVIEARLINILRSV